MELVFTLTGWQFATDGKKSTMFAQCAKLWEWNLTSPVLVSTEQRIQDLKDVFLESTLKAGTLGKNKALMLGSLALKLLSEHAYGRSPKLLQELKLALTI